MENPTTEKLTVKPSLDSDLAGVPAIIIGRCPSTGQFELLFSEGSKIMAPEKELTTLNV